MQTSVAGSQQVEDGLRALLQIAFERVADGDLESAEAYGQQALRLAREQEDSYMMVRALRRLAHVAVLRGDYLTSEQRLLEGLRLSRLGDDAENACLCQYAFARHLQLAGRLAQAENALGEALMHAQRLSRPDLEGMVYLEYAVCRQWLGQLEDQLVYSETALQLFRDSADRDSLFFTLSLALDAADHLGKTHLADTLLSEARSMRDIHGYENVMCGTLAEAALRRFSAGDNESARTLLAEAEATQHASCDFDTLILLQLARGRSQRVLQQAELAARACEAALRLAQQHQSRCHIALARLELAPALVALGQLDEAQATLVDAELAFEQIGAQLSLGRCYCAWLGYYLARRNLLGAASALSKAEGMAQRCEPACGLHLSAELQAAQTLLSLA